MTLSNMHMDSPDYFKHLVSTLSPYRLSTEEMDHPLDPTRNVPKGFSSLPRSPMGLAAREGGSDDTIRIVEDNTPLLRQYMDMVDTGAVSRPSPFDWGTGTPEYVSEVLAESFPPQSLPYLNMGAEAQGRSKINVDGTVFAPDGSALPDAPVEMFRGGGGLRRISGDAHGDERVYSTDPLGLKSFDWLDHQFLNETVSLTGDYVGPTMPGSAIELDPVFNWTNRALDPTPDRFLEQEELMAVDVMSQLAQAGQQRELKTIWDEFDDIREELTFFGSTPEPGEPSFVTQARRDPVYDNVRQKIKTMTYRLITSMDYSHPTWFKTNLNDPRARAQGRFGTLAVQPSLDALNSLTGFNLSYEDSQDPTKVAESVDDFADEIMNAVGHRQNIIRSLAVGRPITDEEIDFDAMSLTPTNPMDELKIYDPETGEFRLMEVAEVLASPEYQARAEKYKRDMASRENIHRTLTERPEFGPSISAWHTETWGQSIKHVLKERYDRSEIVRQARTPWGGATQVLHRLATGQEHEDSMDRRQEAIQYSEEAKYISKSRGPKISYMAKGRGTDVIRDYPLHLPPLSDVFAGEEPFLTSYSPMSAAYQPPVTSTWGWWIKPPSERAQASALALMFPHRQSIEEYGNREAEEMRVLGQYLRRNTADEIEEYNDMSAADMLLNQNEKLGYISSVLARYIKQGEAGDDAFYATEPFMKAGLLSRDLTRETYLDAMKSLQEEYTQNLVENAIIYDRVNSPMSTYDTLMVAAMNEGLGTSFININQVNELAFATVLEKDKFSKAERLNILRTWNMAHTTFVKTIEDANADALIAGIDVSNWGNRIPTSHAMSPWEFSGLDSSQKTRDRIFGGGPLAGERASVYLGTINGLYIDNYKKAYPESKDDQIPASPFSLDKPLDWRGMPLPQANAAMRSLVQMWVLNPLEEGQPIQIKNLTGMIDEGMTFLGDLDNLMGDSPEAEARRNVAARALMYIGYFGEITKTNPDVRQHAAAFGFTDQELIASDLIMTQAARNNPNLGVFEMDVMMDPSNAMDMISAVTDETRKLYKLLSTVYDGSGGELFDRDIQKMFMGTLSDLEHIPWSYSTEWITTYLTEPGSNGRTKYQTLEGKMNSMRISLYEDTDTALQGIANMLGTNVKKLEDDDSKLFRGFFSRESWAAIKAQGVPGYNLAALTIMKTYGLDLRTRQRMGMLLYGARTEMDTQTIDGLVTTANKITTQDSRIEVMGIDRGNQQPIVASSKIDRDIIAKAQLTLAEKDGKSTGEWIGHQWSTSTPENGMLGWVDWLNERDTGFMVGLRDNFDPRMAEYQPIMTLMPGNTVEEREQSFISLRDRAMAATVRSYISPEVLATYNKRGDGTQKDGMYTPKRVDIHLDVLRRMMLDPAWPDRPYTKDGPTKHFQKGLYVDNDGGMGTFGGELVEGTEDTYVYFQATQVSAMNGRDILSRSGSGEAEAGHVRLTSTVTMEGEDWAAAPTLDIVVPWILFGLEQDKPYEMTAEERTYTAMKGVVITP